jgi:DeoR family transcriptional regulator, suf operon transcriptional repressor
MARATTRQKVEAYLKKQHAASAEQIGRALNLETPDVRHHLSVLRGEARIEVLGQRHKNGKGRPVKIYGLSRRALGDNLMELSNSLLDELLPRIPSSKRQEILRRLAKKLTEQIGRIDPSKQGPRRLASLVENLSEHHYEARWEAGAEGPRILFARCPYAAIIENHPELCQVDESMLAEETGGDAFQLAKMDQKPGRNTHCIFQIK